ncbi:MAG: tetratricopeptide repeat protein [Candidatus Aenigmarchaeota archaeon]|nr:tetratricopeptide repeat protein [Candidatus Aenigmarchaeota archaeon]
MIEEGMIKKQIRFYLHLLGRIELKKGNTPEAIEYFNEALSYMPSQHTIEGNSKAIFLDSLAYAYYKADDLEKAQEEYERIISLTVDRIYYGDIYAKSFYMLGRIFEQKDWKGKSIENYEKFLDLWKNTDPGIDEVEDAEKRLAALKSQ